MGRLLMGVDIGTSGCKAAVFSTDGNVCAQATVGYDVEYPQRGWAQQHPDTWWRAACEAIRKVLAGGVDAADIAGIGVAGQSWSAIAMDSAGQVLAPTPIWTDARAEEICRELRNTHDGEPFFSCCGNPLQPGYTLPKILWYERYMPDVYANARWILQSNGYIVYRLTGQVCQDLSQGYGLNCFDMRRGCWDEDVAAQLGVRPELLPPLADCHAVIGGVTAEAAACTGLANGTPVVAGGLDAACGTLGAGVIHHGETQEQGGQAGGMSICLEQYAADVRLILGRHVVPGRWLLQGGTTGGGGALKWLQETFCPDLTFREMSDLAAQTPAGSGGVIFLPYMAGERSPVWNPAAKGVFFGLDYAAGRGRIIRAVMEGVAYSLRHNLETAEKAGAVAKVLRAVGGSANSDVWTQIKADVTGHAIEVAGSDTATTLGAAILAGVGTGVYDGFDDAAAQTVAIRCRYLPSAENRAVYDAGYKRYRELYDRLAPMMQVG